MKISFHKVRHWGLQTIRRGVQLAVLLLVVGLVYLSLYAHYRAAGAVEDEVAAGGFRGEVFARIDRTVATMDEPQLFLDDNKGTLWSMRLAGMELTDPLAAAEVVAASRSIHGPLLVSILVPVVVTLLLGRVFCSWICPAGLLLEVAGKLRAVLRFAELPPANVTFSYRNKYVLLVVGWAVAAGAGLPLFALIYPPAVLSRLAHAWVFGTSLAGLLILLGTIVVVELLISPRWWCRTMCPGGALYALIGWPRLLRVRLDAERCTGCRECEPACEPGLNPVRQSYGIECDNCGVCVRACPDQALYYTIGLPKIGRKRTSTGKKGEQKLVHVTTTAILLAGCFWLLVPSMALGHHILGLPHYSYKENYPQVPVLEYPATTGPYQILFVCYPGKPLPGEPANLVFYIKNGTTDRPYDQPIRVRVLQTYTFGSNREVLPMTEVLPFEVPHKLSATFPEDGEYVVELTMDVEGQDEVISFLMIAGDPSATMSIVLAVVGGLGVFVVVVRAIKKKRDRRMRVATRSEDHDAVGSVAKPQSTKTSGNLYSP